MGIGTAVPPYSASQDRAFQFMSRVFSAGGNPENDASLLAFMKRIYEHSGIEKRHSVLSDYLQDDPGRFTFFPTNWGLDPVPSTARRMQMYSAHAVNLAAEAGSRALQAAGVEARAITHVIFCTCTGFFAPGPDVLLCRRLGLSPHVSRTVIGFMGCCAGFNGMRVARQVLAGHPESLVLQVCVGLCSLHFQKHKNLDTIVANSLFADGASAAVFGAAPRRGLARVANLHSLIVEDSLDHMAWNIGDTGFEMKLAAAVPAALEQNAMPYLHALLDHPDMNGHAVAGWAIHPGGRKILDTLAKALALHNGCLEPSYSVLRDYGNMSSATLFFVLERALASMTTSGALVAIGFGPGLAIEGALLFRES